MILKNFVSYEGEYIIYTYVFRIPLECFNRAKLNSDWYDYLATLDINKSIISNTNSVLCNATYKITLDEALNGREPPLRDVHDLIDHLMERHDDTYLLICYLIKSSVDLRFHHTFTNMEMFNERLKYV